MWVNAAAGVDHRAPELELTLFFSSLVPYKLFPFQADWSPPENCKANSSPEAPCSGRLPSCLQMLSEMSSKPGMKDTGTMILILWEQQSSPQQGKALGMDFCSLLGSGCCPLGIQVNRFPRVGLSHPGFYHSLRSQQEFCWIPLLKY